MLSRYCLLVIAVASLSVSTAVLANRSGEAEFLYPVIKGEGKVTHLPEAADQPREGSKICVDVTAGGEPDAVNPGIAKVARFVNIYGGAGAKRVTPKITVVLHGSATLTALNHDAYRAKFKIARNPNLELIGKLKDAGVEVLVCGQAVILKGGRHADVDSGIQIAVSALTVNVNRQADGYAFIPLH